jgi:hypothetical protein
LLKSRYGNGLNAGHGPFKPGIPGGGETGSFPLPCPKGLKTVLFLAITRHPAGRIRSLINKNADPRLEGPALAFQAN